MVAPVLLKVLFNRFLLGMLSELIDKHILFSHHMCVDRGNYNYSTLDTVNSLKITCRHLWLLASPDTPHSGLFYCLLSVSQRQLPHTPLQVHTLGQIKGPVTELTKSICFSASQSIAGTRVVDTNFKKKIINFVLDREAVEKSRFKSPFNGSTCVKVALPKNQAVNSDRNVHHPDWLFC